MDTPGYVTLTRQAGLLREMQTVANNIANQSTTGFRREGIIFAEHVADTGAGGAISMASAVARVTDLAPAPLHQTGGQYDFAILGDGFFMVATPQGDRLTRAGAFSPSPEGALTSPQGFGLLDEAGAAVVIPPGAGSVTLGADGTLSADGRPVARIGIFAPTPGDTLTREGDALFVAAAPPEPVETPSLVQGALEGSNVDPVREIARMIEVQRAYELGQSFLDKEDARIRSVIETLGR